MTGVHGAGAVEVDVAAIDVKDLSGRMGGAGRGDEGDHVGDLLDRGGAPPEGDGGVELTAGFCGIGRFSQPGLVEGGDDLGRDHAVDADAVFGQVQCPFAGQGVHPAFGGRVTGGAALAGEGTFAPDVDDHALARDKCIQAVVGQGKDLHEVVAEGTLKGIDAVPEADGVVPACVVDHPVDAAVLVEDGLHRGLDGDFIRHLQRVKFRLAAAVSDVLHERLARLGRATDGKGEGAFRRESFHDARTNAFGTAADEIDFIFEFEVHGLVSVIWAFTG